MAGQPVDRRRDVVFLPAPDNEIAVNTSKEVAFIEGGFIVGAASSRDDFLTNRGWKPLLRIHNFLSGVWPWWPEKASKEVTSFQRWLFRWSGVPAAIRFAIIAAGSRSHVPTTFFRVCGHRCPEKAFYVQAVGQDDVKVCTPGDEGYIDARLRQTTAEIAANATGTDVCLSFWRTDVRLPIKSNVKPIFPVSTFAGGTALAQWEKKGGPSVLKP